MTSLAPDESTDTRDLRSTVRPDFEVADKCVRAVDLFCGCGGLTLGLAQACRDADIALDVRLALDFDANATTVYEANFPKATVVTGDIELAFDGALGAPRTDTEIVKAAEVGSVDALVAGPPCQGHSDLNNHTRRDDPKNLLYLRVARAAEILRPRVVLIENVPAVQHDRNRVVANTAKHLQALGYKVGDRTISLTALGVPQRRKRHLLIGISDSIAVSATRVFEAVTSDVNTVRDLRWAIGDLANLTDGAGMDLVPRASRANLARMRWLLDNDEYNLPNDQRPACHQNEDHSYHSMYGRLRWDAPAQTITSGYGSIGQGRYMHPDQARALTAHEAARIQGFPDYFDFSAVDRRDALAIMIANAVPPALARALFAILLTNLSGGLAPEE